jgi:hypothetical protein
VIESIQVDDSLSDAVIVNESWRPSPFGEKADGAVRDVVTGPMLFRGERTADDM